MTYFNTLANDVRFLGNKVNKYIISSKTANIDAKVLNPVIFFSDLVDFFVNAAVFAEKPVAALAVTNSTL